MFIGLSGESSAINYNCCFLALFVLFTAKAFCNFLGE